MAGLHATIESNQDKLDKLKNDQQALKKIVTIAQPKKKMPPVILSPKQSFFGQQRGALPPPINGIQENIFGTPVGNSSVNWQGNLFHASLGKPRYEAYTLVQ